MILTSSTFESAPKKIPVNHCLLSSVVVKFISANIILCHLRILQLYDKK